VASPALDEATYHAGLLESTDRIAEILTSAEPALRVTTCPDWTLSDLALHVGRAHRWPNASPRQGLMTTTDPSPSPAPLAEQCFKVLASETFEKRNLARQPGRVTGWSQHGGKGDIWWPGATFCSLCARYRFGRGCSHPWLCSSGADRSASVRVAFARSRCDSRDTWPEPSSGS
jgi:hypothetical protein